MGISERIKKIVEYSKLTPNAFALKIGVSQPRFRNYLNGRSPDYETISKIVITFVMISERWLLTGEGDMLKNDELYAASSNMVEEKERLIEAQKEIISSQKEIINDQREIIATLKGELKDLNSLNPHHSTSLLVAPSADSASGRHRTKK